LSSLIADEILPMYHDEYLILDSIDFHL
jgi:hypothetical protein